VIVKMEDAAAVNTELDAPVEEAPQAGEPRIRDLDWLADGIRSRLRNDLDVVIAVTGDEGLGKSTLAYQLAKRIDGDFDVEKSTVYNPTYEEVKDKIVGLPKYSAIVVDEAVKTFYKRNFAHKSQIFLNQVFAICRKANKAVILCMPAFSDFDSFFRRRRILIWIHIVTRGGFVCFVKDKSAFAEDCWHQKENDLLFRESFGSKKFFQARPSHLVRAYRKSSNYFFSGEFKKMPAEDSRKYLALAESVKYELSLETEATRKEVDRQMLVRAVVALYRKFGMNQLEIGQLLGASQPRINGLLKEAGVRPLDALLSIKNEL